MMQVFNILLKCFFSKKISNILVVFQNNNELRGGGGFITQLLVVFCGKMKFKLEFKHDYYDLRPKKLIEPPEEVKKYLGLNHWYIRDANLFGSFAKNAESISNNYNTIYQKENVIGVIAINFTVIEKILSIIGVVKLKNEKFDYKNIFLKLTNYVSEVDNHDLDSINNRKNLLQELFNKITFNIILHVYKWPKLIKLFNESIKTKDVQMHFFCRNNNKELKRKNVINKLSETKTTDYLSLVENNFLGLKSNRYIRRMVFHDVKFSFNNKNKKIYDATVIVKIRNEHFGSFNYPLTGTYQSITKVLLPKTATNIQVISKDSEFKINDEMTDKSISYYQKLNVGKSSEIEFKYKLPEKLFKNNLYSFKYIKQSGVKNEHILETVSFPDLYEIEFKQGKGESRENVAFIEHFNVDRDYIYKIAGKLHNQPPRVFFNEIVAPNIIQVRFNEPMELHDKMMKLSDYIVVFDPKTKEYFNVSKVEFYNDNRHILIYVPSLSNKENRVYNVLLSNFQNRCGIKFKSEPKKVTVIYRSKKIKKFKQRKI